MPALTIAKLALPFLFKKAKANPGISAISILLIIMVLACAWLGFSGWRKDNKIDDLTTKCENLESRNDQLTEDLSEANASIDKQNEANLKYKNSIKDLQFKLANANTKNIELDVKVKDLVEGSKDAPLECAEAFKWLKQKSTELKQWQN